MDFDDIPELHRHLGYPFALVLMPGVGLTPYAVFERRDWI